MHAQGIQGVDFIICNTDRQALDISPIAVKLQIGSALTKGLGAGSIPERGKSAAQENLEEIRQLLSTRTEMVFITAGMGGGTGTGAAPVIASVARQRGVLTVGIVTMPFQWEGRKRKQQAASGIEEMRKAVDTLLVINNDRLRDLYGNLSLDNAFMHADNVLTTAARGIAEIITETGKINVDFEDVKTVMTESGVAIMGMAEAEGEDRALRAAQEALASPLLNDNDIKGAKYVLLNITHGSREVLMDEISEITDHIQDAAGSSADVIWGYGRDESLGDALRVTVIATGFHMNSATGAVAAEPEPERKVVPLDADLPTIITQPIANPLETGKLPTAPAPEPAENEPYLKPAAETPAQPERQEAAPPAEKQRTIEFEVEPRPPFRPAAAQEDPAPAASPEKQVFHLTDEPEEGVGHEVPEVHASAASPASPPSPAPPAMPGKVEREPAFSPMEHQNRVEDRLARMREMTVKLRTPSGLSEMENEPAFRRKKVVLNEGPKSSDSNVSRYTLNEEVDENGERRVELRKNNPYLHDNVD